MASTMGKNLKLLCLLIYAVIAMTVSFAAYADPTAAEQPASAVASTDTLLAAFPDRRKEQFQTSPGYALFPYPYQIPGIGKGVGLVGGMMNIGGSYTDAYGIAFTGDVQGFAGGVADIHLIPRTLILDVGYSRVNKATLQSYSVRGMDSSKDDYRLLEIEDSENYGGRLTATFLERRMEVYGGWYQRGSRLGSIRDKDGNIIVEAQGAERSTDQTLILGTRFDLTDDYNDPRRGVRLDISRFHTPPTNSGPDFSVYDFNFTGYVPIGTRSTWAFNYLRSDAVVSSQGETDPSVIQQQNGINCSSASLTPLQQQYCNEVVSNIIANNTYGTATSLGGLSRLRSYSQARFRGAHTQFYGTELRWNLTDESTPFDIFVMKDVRTAFQLAFFYEIGSTADLQQDVGKTWRQSYGAGLRMVTASGVVFRADIANGSEGVLTEIFIGYPWEIF